MKHVARVTAAVVLLAYAVGCGGKTELPSPTPPSPTDNPPPNPLPPYPPPTPTDNPSEPPVPVSPPAPSPPNPTKPLPPNTCLSLFSDSYSNGNAVAIASIDLTTGKTTLETKIQKSSFGVGDVSSIGLYGSDVLACGGSSIVRISRIDGSVSDVANRSCEAVTADEQGIYVLNGVGGRISRYADLTALAAGSPSTDLGYKHASRLGPSKNGLLAAWHSTSWIFMGNDYFTFEGYDDWNYGVSGATGGEVVISSARADGTSPGLIRFDAKGKRLGNVLLPKPTPTEPGAFMGLTCAY